MLRITIFAVGKLKEQFWKDAVAEYLKRLGGYAKIEVRELPDSQCRKGSRSFAFCIAQNADPLS